MRIRRDPLLNLVLIWTALVVAVPLWVPLVRGLVEGAAYAWSLGALGGAGTGGDFWLLVLLNLLALAVLLWGWRGARWPFHLLLLGWHVPVGVAAVQHALVTPEAVLLTALGRELALPLVWLLPALFAMPALLAVWWAAADLTGGLVPRERPEWTGRNSRLFVAAILMLPAHFLLVEYGQPYELPEAVHLTPPLLQWLLLVASLYPWRPPETPYPRITYRAPWSNG